MNKKGEGEHWWIALGAIGLLIAIFALLIFYSNAFAKLREGFGSAADTETIKKAYSETIGKESRLTEEELKIIDQFNLFFQKNFAADDDDCIKKIDFAPIKGKGFGIGVRGGDVFAEKKDKSRVYPLVLSKKISLFLGGRVVSDFSLNENFDKIDGRDGLSNWIYKKNDVISFMDEISG